MKKMVHTLLLASVFFASHPTHTLQWDTKHFVNYTSNAISNTALLSLTYLNAFLAMNSLDAWHDEPLELVAPLAVTLSCGWFLLQKYHCNTPDKTVLSAIKDGINAHADAFLIIAMALPTHEELAASATFGLMYTIKYALVNHPSPADASNDEPEELSYCNSAAEIPAEIPIDIESE